MSQTGILHRHGVRGSVATQTSQANRANARPTGLHAQIPMLDRRALLSGCALLVSLNSPQHAQSAILCVEQETTEAADDCRKKVLQGDAGKGEDYGKFASRTFETAGGVPVADMGDRYAKETLALYASITKYATMDPYDKSRPQVIKSLKQDAANWVSEYARGGSARKQSARKMYVAADAVSGHLSSNGFAPFPAYKFKNVRLNMDEALVFLNEGK